MSKRAIEVAVRVGIGGREILVDGDRAGVVDVAGEVGVGEDAGGIVRPDIAIVPSFLTLSLLLMVTAAPLAGLTEPAVVMRMSSLAVPVATGVVTAVLMTVSAEAGAAAMVAAMAVRPVVASRRRIQKTPPRTSGRQPNGRTRCCWRVTKVWRTCARCLRRLE